MHLVYGTNDEYLNEVRMQEERNRAFELFGNNVTVIPFEGKHEVNVDLITRLV